MADVEVTYNNTKIVELSESGTKTLKTAGKYCEGDIVLEYEKPMTPDPTTSINFYDYDGTLVDQWPLTELQNKTDLPDCPAHDGLTSQGWNWSLSDLKSLNRAMNVGAVYIPTDGKTHYLITIPEGLTQSLVIAFNQTTSSIATIDWGDGTTPQVASGTGSLSFSHTYTSSGDYDLTIEVASGKSITLQSTSGTASALRWIDTRGIHFGSGVRILCFYGALCNPIYYNTTWYDNINSQSCF